MEGQKSHISLRGHVATMAAYISGCWAIPRSEAVPLTLPVGSSKFGYSELRALYSKQPEADEIVVLVHGMGGSMKSVYMPLAADAFAAQGMSVLRLSQRGAGGAGNDLHHAGLWQDLDDVLQSSLFQPYTRIYLVGFSMGGHVALHLAYHRGQRIHAMAALCTPLLLAPTVAHLDQPHNWFYRKHLLTGLKSMARGVGRRGCLNLDLSAVERAGTLREWDHFTVVPRFGFASCDDYYNSQSAVHLLDAINVPTLFVYTSGDPMVPLSLVRKHFDSPTKRLARSIDVKWLNGGGHVAFPSRCEWDRSVKPGIYSQVAHWLRRS